MSISFSGRATIDPNAPEALGVCDRCGHLYNLRELQYQPIIAGPTVIVTRRRVCWQCLDELNPQFQTVRLPPDPAPVSDPRPAFYALDEKQFYEIASYIGRPGLFSARGRVECELQVGEIQQKFISAALSGASAMAATLKRAVTLAPAFSGASAMAATFAVNPTVSQTATFSTTTPATTTNFTSLSFGAEESDRYMLALLGKRSNAVPSTISGVTIGGVTASQLGSVTIVNNANPNPDTEYAEIWAALVPTGTSGTVAVSHANANWYQFGGAVLRVTGLGTTPSIYASSNASSNGASNVHLDLDVNTLNNIVLVGWGQGAVTGLTSIAWSGLSDGSSVSYGTGVGLPGTLITTSAEAPRVIDLDWVANNFGAVALVLALQA